MKFVLYLEVMNVTSKWRYFLDLMENIISDSGINHACISFAPDKQ